MADWAGGYGAGGAADALREIVAQKLLERKQAEIERANRAQDAAAAAALQQRADESRQAQGQRMTEFVAERDQRYQDALGRKSEREQDIAERDKDRKLRLDERAADAAAREKDREDRQEEDRAQLKSRQDFERSLMSGRASGPQPGYQWVNRGGKPVYTNQVQPGDTPQSTREQGRPVGTSDANRVADLDTSLDDLATLKEALPKGSTGLAAQAGAALPNVVTEMTGLGSVAKQKQAMIDRVRQVIGKALEGGVLRKEDEAKYEKILPTLKDPDDIVASKLQGLESAIQQRRGVLLENLEHSGYDVSKFPTERKGNTSGGGGMVPMITPDGRSINVPAAMVAEAEKRGAKRSS